MQSTGTIPATVEDYFETVPANRAMALAKIRHLCVSGLVGYKESMDYGMPSYSKNGTVQFAFNNRKDDIAVYILVQDVVANHADAFTDLSTGLIVYNSIFDIDYNLLEEIVEEINVSSSPFYR